MLHVRTLYVVHYLKLLTPHLHTSNIVDYLISLLDQWMEGIGQSRNWISVIEVFHNISLLMKHLFDKVKFH